MTDFGPTGQLVYERTYSRPKKDGSRETWPETVERVVDGNLKLTNPKYLLASERQELVDMMNEFKIIPAGRQLWATGVKGRQYLYNCFVSGWGEKPSDHFEFTFMRLMEGGGVGANYSNHHLEKYSGLENELRVHIVCDEDHPDYQAMSEAGLLSNRFVDDWEGCFQVEDSREGWAAALVDLIDTHFRDDILHVDRVYDVSRVREAGTKLRTFGGYASGPLPLARMMIEINSTLSEKSFLTGMAAMDIDHAIAQCVVAGGNRRSARMSIMHWDDPEIQAFLSCKQDTGKHWTTNISVEIDEEFKRQAGNYGSFASLVLESISLGMLENGEPGIWDSEYSNEDEPNEIIATNPCGEIPLEPWEACNLGHVNLAAFVDDTGHLDVHGVYRAHMLMARFLVRSTFGDRNDPKQAAVMDRNRRIGLGHFGFAEFVHLLGIGYAESAKNPTVRNYLRTWASVVTETVQEYSHNLRIPVPVKMRTVAPTGTIAKLPGTTEGIHPIFAKHFIRRIRFSDVDPEQFATALSYAAKGYHVEPCQYAANTTVVSIPTEDITYNKVVRLFGEEKADRIVQSPAELELEEMLAVQAMYQTYWADNAVSYTANVDPARYNVEGVSKAILGSLGEVKGATIFPEMSRPQSPYERLSKADYDAAPVKDVTDSVDEECVNGCPVR